MKDGRRMWTWCAGTCLVLIVLSLTVPLAFAFQDPPAGGGGTPAEGGGTGDGQPASTSKSLLDIINAGSWVGHCIIVISVIALALGIQYAMTIQRDKMVPPEMVVEIETLLEEQRYEDLVMLCEGQKNYLTSIVGAALASSPDGFEAMESSAGTAMDEENLKLNVKISYMNLLSNIGPLLGLFGTVTGMIGAFMVIETMASPPPSMLAKGIYEALVTTVEGLIVGIPGVAVYFYFKNKVSLLTFELGTVALELVSKLKPIAGQEIVVREEQG